MTVLWDWNGTLLNDAEPVAELTSRVFRDNGYRETTLEEYRRLFRFPVKDYYRDMGIPEEDFDRMANLWSQEYDRSLGVADLRKDTLQVLERFRRAGWRQAIISAGQQGQLDRQLEFHPQVRPFMEEIRGLADIYAAGKVGIAAEFLEQKGIAPAEVCFIGDTSHDAEVARRLGLKAVLVRGGHQCDEGIGRIGVPVADSLTGAADLLLGKAD